ncbi:MAG: class I SAM-dependent methyltransferase [Nocardioides sp.]
MTLTPSRTRPSSLDWPGLEVAPTGPRTVIAAALARRLFAAAVNRLPVTVHIGDGVVALGTGGPEMTIHRPEEFFARIGTGGLIGFGEAYLTQAWDAEDLGAFLTVLAAEMPTLIPARLQKLRAAYVARPPRHQKSSVANSRANIGHHYDLSNELFETFLDETLTYSSALFDTPVVSRGHHRVALPPLLDGAVPASVLHQAQTRKIERLLDDTHVGPGTRLLEIGTGWGELAIRAARRGATVRSVTLSIEQQAFARERVAAAAADGEFDAGQVSIELCDYRQVADPRGFDVICSIEMIEAVGYDYWQEYFRTIDGLLAPGGRVGIQAITMPHDRMLATRRTYTWINKYIFPGGFLPSVEVIDEITRTHTDLRLTDRLSFGSHYAETLRAWDTAFMAAHDRVREPGFDETFVRMWHFYLDYSRAGFASGYIDVNQTVLAPK